MHADGMGSAGLLVCQPCGANAEFDITGVFNVPQKELLGSVWSQHVVLKVANISGAEV